MSLEAILSLIQIIMWSAYLVLHVRTVRQWEAELPNMSKGLRRLGRGLAVGIFLLIILITIKFILEIL